MKTLRSFSDRRDNPILLDTGLGIMTHLRPAIIFRRRGGKDFDHEVWRTINRVVMDDGTVADNHGVGDIARYTSVPSAKATHRFPSR